MSTQAELNLHPTLYVLHYCSVGQSDTTVYQIDCSDVCTLSYDGSDNLVVSGWLISGYSAPSIPTLLGYTLAAVQASYFNFYEAPALIAATQPYKLTSSALANIRTDSSMQGYCVCDTTLGQFRMWNGSTWKAFAPGQYLALDGTSAMAGALDMNSNAIANATIVHQSAPSAASIYSTDSVSISFTANTARTIPITNFTTVLNNNFTVNSSTGQLTYTGSTTRIFRVTIDYSYTSLSPLGTTTLLFFISKAGSTTITKRKAATFVALGQISTWSDSISDCLSLANGDTIILGGQYGATASISISSVSYSVSQL